MCMQQNDRPSRKPDTRCGPAMRSLPRGRNNHGTSRKAAEMPVEPALLSATSALVGAIMGGGASLAAAIYTQRYQDRLQRVARETTKRETVYADFIMHGSKLLRTLT